MNIKKSVKYLSVVAVAITLAACGSSTSDNEAVVGGDSSTTVNSKDTKAQNVFYSIPSPIETISLLKGAGAKYNAKYLNPIGNVSKYSSIAAKALNLGVYGSDLSFTSIFDQSQESMSYFRCASDLSTGLGISGSFDEKTMDRVEANMGNRDSLLAIISNSYWTTDAYLKDNGQPGVSALIVVGGWIEGLYIATQIANTTKNEKICTRIGEQKLSLDNLVALLEDQKANNRGIADILVQMNDLKKIYDGIDVKTSETKVSTDKAKEVTTLDNGSSFKLTDEQLKQITDKATEIRNKIIQ